MNAPINTAVLARDARNIGLTPINGFPTGDALNSVVAAWNAFRKEGGNWRDAVGFAANSEGHVWVVVNPGANTGFDLWDFISKDIAAQWSDITKYLARNKRKPLLDAPSPASISDLVVDIPIQTFPACAPANLIAAYGGPAPQEPMQPAPMPVMEPEPEPVIPPQPEPMPVVEPEPVMPPQPVMPVVEEAPVVVPEPVIEQVAPTPQSVVEPATAPTPQVPVMPAPTDMPIHMPPPQPAPLTYSDGDELTGFLDEEADTSQWVLRNLITGETYPVPTHPAIIGRSPTSSEIPVGHGDAKRPSACLPPTSSNSCSLLRSDRSASWASTQAFAPAAKWCVWMPRGCCSTTKPSTPIRLRTKAHGLLQHCVPWWNNIR